MALTVAAMERMSCLGHVVAGRTPANVRLTVSSLSDHLRGLLLLRRCLVLAWCYLLFVGSWCVTRVVTVAVLRAAHDGPYSMWYVTSWYLCHTCV